MVSGMTSSNASTVALNHFILPLSSGLAFSGKIKPLSSASASWLRGAVDKEQL
jgi:hypothetical protein